MNAVSVRRSELTLGGHDMRMLNKAAQTDADQVMADLEDACPLSFKGEPVRKTIVEAFTTIDWGEKLLAIRPNNTRSPYFEGDIEYIVTNAVDRFHTVVMPKVNDRDQIEQVDALLTRCERASGWTRRIQIEVLIETALGVENAFRIATASDRMSTLTFGVADYAADLGIADAFENQNIRFLFAKQRTVNAAKAAGLDALDGVHLRFRDIDALRVQCLEGLGYGFDGKWCIHPSHIPVVNEIFTPTVAQLAHAKKVVDLYEEADSLGRGALADPDTGEMIDEATIKIAFKQLVKGAKAGLVDSAFIEKATRNAAYTGYNFLGG